ncbi:MAG: AmmeMemoRadiSam system protein B [Chloroflexi bacterium]|nr:AmmeMemoRadiSam system protein B [Chloroflexota bacterium]
MRRPAVAGLFYPDSAQALHEQIDVCFTHPLGPPALSSLKEDGPRQILGLITPHAGYAYSGPVAAHAFAALASDGRPDVVVIVGPNHRGLGAPIAIAPSGAWQTPLGDVDIDEEVAQEIAVRTSLARRDSLAHLAEHSIEVQVPFLQYVYGERFRLVPIVLRDAHFDACLEIGEAIGAAVEGKNVVLIASTDFTHYESHESAIRKDRQALDAIEQLDAGELRQVIEDGRITMCGPGAVATVLAACKHLGARSASVLRYATSGDISGDYSSVVGYAAVQIVSSPS